MGAYMQLEQIWEYRKPVSQEHIDAIDAALDNEGDLVNSLPIVRTALCCRRARIYPTLLRHHRTRLRQRCIRHTRDSW